ncbi:MAG TPA: dihydroorotate dehydrogenase-like protein [Candidatus Limnocylindrales bacterium]|nr:dihydroorotate dehydrogenase-like protein [Candidatus Limnocylindrales bacterium]
MTVDLRTRYLGLELRSPLVCSSSPYTGDLATARRMERAGAGAIVLPSLFEEEILNEEIQLTRALEAGTNQFAEALDYFPAIDSIPSPSDRYVELIAIYKRELRIPVIASLNAATPGGWVRYARQIQQAGADALELNLYHLVADPRMTAADREAMDLELIRAVRAVVTIPVTIKLSPFYSALAGFAVGAVSAGADGLVMFNRFYQPDLDLDTFDVVNRVELSHSSELRQPLRWIAILRPILGPGVSLAATSGVHSGTDAVKALLVGADVAMMTSAILKHGPEFVHTVEQELVEWLETREYESVSQLRGAATAATMGDPTAFERANYMATLHSWSTPPELATA